MNKNQTATTRTIDEDNAAVVNRRRSVLASAKQAYVDYLVSIGANESYVRKGADNIVFNAVDDARAYDFETAKVRRKALDNCTSTDKTERRAVSEIAAAASRLSEAAHRSPDTTVRVRSWGDLGRLVVVHELRQSYGMYVRITELESGELEITDMESNDPGRIAAVLGKIEEDFDDVHFEGGEPETRITVRGLDHATLLEALNLMQRTYGGTWETEEETETD